MPTIDDSIDPEDLNYDIKYRMGRDAGESDEA